MRFQNRNILKGIFHPLVDEFWLRKPANKNYGIDRDFIQQTTNVTYYFLDCCHKQVLNQSVWKFYFSTDYFDARIFSRIFKFLLEVWNFAATFWDRYTQQFFAETFSKASLQDFKILPKVQNLIWKIVLASGKIIS